MNDIEKKLEALEKEAKMQKKQEEPKPWKPAYGQNYFALSVNFTACKCTNYGERFEEYPISIGNCFRTKKRAEEVADKILLLLRLEQLHDMLCPDYEPDWGSGEATYCLYYDHSSSRWAVDGWYDCNCRVNGAYFDTLENAEKVAEILNKELEKSK